MFYKDVQRMFERKTSVGVNVKSFLQNRVTERKRERYTG